MQRNGWLRLGVGLVTLGILGTTAQAVDIDPAEAFEVLSTETLHLENLPATPDQPFEVNVTIEGEQHTLLLGAWSLRSDNFQVLTIGDDGIPTPFEAGEPLTVRGGSMQDPSIVVAGSLLPEGLKVIVTRVGPQQISWGIEPMRKIDPNADRADHIIYRVDESLATGLCGNDNHVLEDLDHAEHVEHGDHGDHGELNGRILKLTEIAHDADFPFYQLNGSSETNVINDIENVMASVTVVYERDVEITWENVSMIIRTSSGADPYSSTDPSGLLSQFRSHWLVNFPVATNQRDIAHLWTGRNIDGSVIGIAASIGGVCTNNSYCLSQSRFTGNFASRVALTAHEIGHVYGAFHCNQSPFVSNPCNIMCSGLGGCNGVGLPNFNAQSIQMIIDHAATRPCLEDVPENLVLPVVDDFDGAGGTPDPAIWETTLAAVTSNFATFEPSGDRSLNIFGAGSVSSVSATFAGPDPIYVGLWAEANGVNPGQALLFEYFDFNSAQFEELFRFEPVDPGTVDTLFAYQVAELPASANGTDARFRIRATGGTQWYADSMRIGDVVLHGLPFIDHVDGTDISGAHWFMPTLAEFDGGSIGLTVFDTLTSLPIQGDYWLNDSRPMFMSFTVDQNDVPAGMSLIAEVSDGAGGWVELINVPSGGAGMGGPETVQAPIPVSSQTNPMQVRIRTEGTVVFGTSYLVDDIVVGDQVAVAPPTCVGDIADDFGTLGNDDGMVSFGDFLAMLGLVGPCPGGTPGCVGDIADGFGTINGGDGAVDFGDFLALLGLVGPCP